MRSFERHSSKARLVRRARRSCPTFLGNIPCSQSGTLTPTFQNLASAKPEVAARLKKKSDTWLTRVDAIIPSEPNPAYHSNAGAKKK